MPEIIEDSEIRTQEDLSHRNLNADSKRLLSCWVVSNGRAGTQNQALGLAQAMRAHLPLSISIKHIDIPKRWSLVPGALWPNPFNLLTTRGHLLRAPFPDIWVASGRESVPLTIAVKRQSLATFTVQTQNPHAPSNQFDLVVPPEHDKVRGKNVFPIIGSPSCVNPAAIERSAIELGDQFNELGKPRLAVLIGGENKKYKMDDKVMDQIIDHLQNIIQQGYNLIITNSRRTKHEHWELLRARLGGPNAYFVSNNEGLKKGNIYPAFLAIVDGVIVTQDSVNMIGEAVSTGKPVYTLTLKGSGGKFAHFHERLEKCGAVRPFKGTIESWTYDPIDETARAAAHVASCYLETKSRMNESFVKGSL